MNDPIRRAETVESIVTADVGGRIAIDTLREAAADHHDDPPVMAAADLLDDAVSPGEVVVIVTGFLIPPTMEPETDGPPGAVSLARALDRLYDADAVIACEPGAVEACVATARAGGLSVVDRETSRESARTVAVEAFPDDRSAASEYADELLDLDPAATVAVEKVGPNRRDVFHNMAGYDISDGTAKVDELFDLAADVPTVGIGDAGNEIGMGTVEDAVRNAVPRGDACQCGCGDGIACSVATDVLVPAAVSNWGAHGIVTCLGLRRGERPLHAPATERRMLDACGLAGAIDGIGGGTDGWCDGLPIGVHESVVRLLGEIPRESVYDRGGGELGRESS